MYISVALAAGISLQARAAVGAAHRVVPWVRLAAPLGRSAEARVHGWRLWTHLAVRGAVTTAGLAIAVRVFWDMFAMMMMMSVLLLGFRDRFLLLRQVDGQRLWHITLLLLQLLQLLLTNASTEVRRKKALKGRLVSLHKVCLVERGYLC